MMNIAKFITLLVAWAISSVGYSSELSETMELVGLSPYPIEKIGDRQFFSNQKFLSIKNGNLIIEGEGSSGNVLNLRVGNVEYIGTNNGEWGGKLEVIENGERRGLMSGNIVHLQIHKGSLYVIEGLSHLSISSGSISVIDNPEQPTEPRLLTLLPDGPELVYVDKTRPDYQPIVMVGEQSLMSISPFGSLEILHWYGFWSYKLRPTSIVRFDDNYLIGLPHGVVAIPAPNGGKKVVFYADYEFNK